MYPWTSLFTFMAFQDFKPITGGMAFVAEAECIGSSISVKSHINGAYKNPDPDHSEAGFL
jgi:hypothetical protein